MSVKLYSAVRSRDTGEVGRVVGLWYGPPPAEHPRRLRVDFGDERSRWVAVDALLPEAGE